jgi:large subunit ribosomal protein L22
VAARIESVARAQLRYLGVSAQKTRLVVDPLRGLDVDRAIGVLRHSPKRVARDIEKLMKSAVANAQQKDPNVDVDRLVVRHAVVDDAPPLKRSRHTSLGRVFRVLKRACHVTIDLGAKGRA